MPTIHLLIKGKVQGVFYRVSARNVAKKLGLAGWIRNTAEGHVEAEATGDAVKLREFEIWCRRGPEEASVTDVIVNALEEKQFDGYIIK